jgi:hypothetical protein
MSARRMSREEMKALVNDWNEHYPIGTSVTVEEDNETISKTKTRSAAWMLGASPTGADNGHTAVIQLDDRAGCFLLERITPSRHES